VANRLSRITTRTGDDGSTGLGDGTRVGKDSLRIQALGDVDELNSHLGLLLCEPMAQPLRDCLTRIQHDLFELGAELCIPGHTALQMQHIKQLDTWVAQYNATLPALKEFILPGGCRAASLAHVARTVCRRAERSVVTLGKSEPLQETTRQYLNRLSDLLFILARVLNQHAETADTLWQRAD
jgi:cob(I)alamin adenosyltransferase